MIRKQVPKLLTIVATAACIFGFVLVAPAETPTLSPMPVAGAQPLGNGYDVTCTKSNDNQVVCVTTGCPRVKGEDAGDVIHTQVNHNTGAETEIGKACGNSATETINASGPFTYSLQGCRKHWPDSDDCGAWADYQYTPPQAETVKCNPPENFVAAEVPAGQQCQPKPKVTCPQGSPTTDATSLDQCLPAPPKTCPPGSAQAEVPFGQECAGPTNAVSLNITQEGLNANAAVTNNSALPAECAYTATKTGGLIGPANVNRSVSVPANGTANITDMLWPPPLVSYRATVKCTATYDGKQVTIGESTQNVQG
jgi:hypothetical protein